MADDRERSLEPAGWAVVSGGLMGHCGGSVAGAAVGSCRTRTRHILMALGVAMFLTIGCQTNPQTTGHYIDDTAITTSVKTQLATDSALKTMTQISVKTVENTVYLTGVAPTMQAKNRAEEITSHVDGVQRVVNNITVQP